MSLEKNRIQLYLYGEHHVKEQVLPMEVDGHIPLFLHSNEQLIEVIARETCWYFVQNENCQIMNCSTLLVKIEIGHRYELLFHKQRVLILAYIYQKHHHIFSAYQFPKHKKVEIGRNKKSTILYKQDLISSSHAYLYYDQASWWIKDEGSKNHTYVNGERISEKRLYLKDCVQILGLKILVSNDCFFINHREDIVISKTCLPYQLPQTIIPKKIRTSSYKILIHESFHFTKHHFQIESLPPLISSTSQPLLFMLGPAITMGISSLSMGVFALLQMQQAQTSLSQSFPTLIMSFSMATGTILWPCLMRRYEKQQTKEKESKRQKLYQTYLVQVKAKIQEELLAYRSSCISSYFDTAHLFNKLSAYEMYGYTTLKGQAISCVLGTGSILYDLDIEFPHNTFSLEEDVLQDELQKLAHSHYEIEQIPILLDFGKYRNVYIDGEEAYAYMLNLLLQLSMRYFSSLTLVLGMQEEMLWQHRLQFLSCLFAEDKETRYLVCEQVDAKRVLSVLEKEIHLNPERYYCFFDFTHKHLLKSLYILQKYENTFFFSLSDQNGVPLPLAYIHVKQKEGKLSLNHQDQTFSYTLLESTHQAIFQLSNLPCENKQQHAFTKVCRFLDLYACGNVAHLNIWERWNKADISQSLEVPIGVQMDGSLLYLDVHEKAHGPHGLFAGMTGSGKSECLLTYVLSLALSFSPQDVSFMFIDYKGGTMAKSFAKLPHTCGIITNLEDSLMKRVSLALQKELKHRQRLLSEACVLFDIANMDIDKYHILCQKQPDLEKLSHLFIIADEFAELKSQQVEFLEFLKQSARIGRSLGIHLLLATQKPAGIIDDQIWSNSRFHICMKVQSTQDSVEMLKKEDAAYLKKAGECCFQVGSDEVYEKAKIAWVQSPYVEREVYCEPLFDEVAILHHNGSYKLSNKLQSKSSKTHQTQMEAVLKQIIKTVALHPMKARSIWKEPFVVEQFARFHPNAFVLIDDIANQQQYPFFYQKEWLTHIFVFGANSMERQAFLKTFMYVLCSITKHDEYVIYMLDFEQGYQMDFVGCQGIADWIYEQEEEKVESLFYTLRKEVERRKQQMQTEPFFLLMINAYETFHEVYSSFEEDVLYLIREGEKRGIYVILSANASSGIPYRMLLYHHHCFQFKAQDDSEYQLAFDNPLNLKPNGNLGSGIMQYESTSVLFQTLLCESSDLQKVCKSSSSYKIKTLPKHVKHNIEDEKNCWYLGMDIKSKEDIYCTLQHHIYFLCAAYQHPQAFLKLSKAQLNKLNKTAYFIEGNVIWKQTKKVNTTHLLEALRGHEKYVFVWESTYELQDHSIQMYLNEQLINDHHSHLFIFTMREQSAYMACTWFSIALFEATILWVAKGLSEYAYFFKTSFSNQELKGNQACLLEEDTTIMIQLWEEEEHG